MADTILIPNSVRYTGRMQPNTGDIVTAVSDSDDNTWASPTGPTDPTGRSYAQFTLSDYVLPANTQIRGVRGVVRISQPSGSESYSSNLYRGASEHLTGTGTFVPTSAIQEFSTPTLTAAPSGAAWTQDDINSLEILVSNTATGTTDDGRVYRLYAVVTTNQRPTVTIVDPLDEDTVVAGNQVVSTSRPTVSWTFTDSEGDAQEAAEVRWVTVTTSTVTGLDIESLTPSATATITGSTQSAIPSTDLQNGVTYKVYVKASDVGSNGAFGPESSKKFTMALIEPAAPSFVVTPENAAIYGPRMKLEIYSRDNLLTANQSSVETDTTGLVVQNACTISRTTTQAAHGVASLALTSTADLTATQDNMRAGTITGINAVPVTVGKSYIGIASVRAAGITRDTTVAFHWYNSAGGFLSTTESFKTMDSAAAWQQRVVVATAPAGAAFAAVVVRFYSPANGEVHYIDKLMLAPGYWNWITNPSAEVNATDWVYVAGATAPTITRDTERAYHGAASVKIVSNGGQPGVTCGSMIKPIQSGAPSTFSVWVYSEQQATVSLTFQWQSAGGTLVGEVISSQVIILPNVWTRVAVTGTPTSPTISPRINLIAGTTIWVDASQVEVGATTQPFVASDWTIGGITTAYFIIESNDVSASNTDTNWVTVRGGTKIQNTTPGTTYTIYDYEAPPNKVRYYRARAVRTA